MVLHRDHTLPKIISPEGKNEGSKYLQQFGKKEQKFMYEFSYTKGNTGIGQVHVHITLTTIFFFSCLYFSLCRFLKTFYSILHQRKCIVITVLEYIRSWYIDLQKIFFNIRVIDIQSPHCVMVLANRSCCSECPGSALALIMK